jgi:diguanylate cyclase (GGDEF)-like protein/PAS domain S-box-containing protein
MTHPAPQYTLVANSRPPRDALVAPGTLLRTLIVEDNADDAELIARELLRAGYELAWTRVESEPAYLAALADRPDIVLCDYRLHGFSGMRALELLKPMNLDMPFIMVSGAIGEDLAVQCMVAGARDCISKNNLARLAPAVARELQQAALRRERREALAQLEQRGRALQERVKEMTCLYEIARLGQQSELTLPELFERIAQSMVTAYRWPEAMAIRIVHGDIVKQSHGFRPTPWRQHILFDTAPATSGAITACYLEQRDWGEEGPFLPEERQLIEAVVMRVKEIIEDRQLRAALAQSERSLRATFDQAALGIVHVSLDRRYLETNQKFCDMTGYRREELLGMDTARIVHPEDWHKDAEEQAQLLAGSITSYGGEKRLIRKDGSVLHCFRTASLVRDDGGQPLYFVRIIEDITARKQLEALAEQTFEQAAVGILRTDLERNILAVNRKFSEMTGYSREELLRMSVKQISHPDDLNQDLALRKRLLAGEIGTFQSEKRYVCKEGKVIWVRRTTSLTHDETGSGSPQYIIVVEDITERKQAQDALAQERLLLRTVIDALPDRIYVKDREGRFILHNTANLAVRGFDDFEDIRGKTVYDFFAKEVADRLAAEDRRVIETGEAIIDREGETIFGANSPYRGSSRWHLTTKIPLRDAAGGIQGVVGITRDITERKRADEALKQTQDKLRTAINSANVGLWEWDLETNRVYYSQEWKNQLGYAEDEIGDTIDEWKRLVHPEDEQPTLAKVEAYLAAPHPNFEVEFRMRHKNGSWRWMLSKATLQAGEDGKGRRLSGGHIDITERKRIEQALRESEDTFRQLVDHIPQVFWMTDAEQQTLVYISPAYERITGRPTAELTSDPRAWLAAVHILDRDSVRRARKSQAPAGNYDIEYRIVRPDRTVRWIHDRAFPITDQTGKVCRVAGISEDVTEQKEAQQKLLHMAHYDSLTGLPNRALFHDRLRHALTQALRHNAITGILFIDLDRFKAVNDTLGHSAGDQLLQQVADRLKQCLRSGDTVSRLGGDEFAVILPELTVAKDTAVVAQKIITALAAPFMLEKNEVFVTASIGITVSPQDGTDTEVLLRNADSAMYDAKAQGRNNFKFYTPEMNVRAQERLQLEMQLRRALERQEFRVHYQPKFSLRECRLSGFEALLRWQHADNGLVAPDRFIPLLEETGLIVPVGQWLMRTVCRQIRQWNHAGLKPVPVAINFSPRQFLQEDVAAMISATLNEFIVSPRHIDVEITESSLMQNPEQAIDALQRVKALGIRIAVDDFGTGYSSLNYLKRFPIDTLKIDRSFVRDIVTDSDDAAIVNAVITLAHSLDLGVVAEGVETREQLDFLQSNGCDEGQGYFFAKPMPPEQCAEFMQRLQCGKLVPDPQPPAPQR